MQEFQIKGEVGADEDDCEFSVRVDGIRVGGMLFEAGEGETALCLDRAAVHSGYESSLAFATLTTTGELILQMLKQDHNSVPLLALLCHIDDENLLENGQNVDDVGSILVKWYRCIPLTRQEMKARRKELIEERARKVRARNPGARQVAKMMPGAHTIHEVNKKLASHCVQYVYCQPVTHWTSC